jgi:hypothetical protein
MLHRMLYGLKGERKWMWLLSWRDHELFPLRCHAFYSISHMYFIHVFLCTFPSDFLPTIGCFIYSLRNKHWTQSFWAISADVKAELSGGKGYVQHAMNFMWLSSLRTLQMMTAHHAQRRRLWTAGIVGDGDLGSRTRGASQNNLVICIIDIGALNQTFFYPFSWLGFQSHRMYISSTSSFADLASNLKEPTSVC